MSCRASHLIGLCASLVIGSTAASAQLVTARAQPAAARQVGAPDVPANVSRQDLVADAAAPDLSADPPAHVSWLEGDVALERDGQPDLAPANMPLLAGDRVRTDAGRVEILFADGSTIHLDARTTVDFQSDDLMRLMRGRIRLSIPGRNRDVRYRIDTPSAAALIETPGEYRVSIIESAREPETELAVLRGSALLVSAAGETPLGAGQRAVTRGRAAPSYAHTFNSAAWDDFDRWSEGRRDQRLGASAQYLPEEVRPYAAAFSRGGSWQHDAVYGYVWYPSVTPAWRPYSNGRWVTLRPYGWTWVGADAWDWPTHHYGRWGVSAGAWFWMPGRRWAPAWVSWASAPGYVGWCPLGWDNRPVFQMASAYRRAHDPWRAWTAVPARYFGGRANVRQTRMHDRDLRREPAFVARTRGPEVAGHAVPRSVAPIRIAGTVAGRPATSPVYTNLAPAASRVSEARSRTLVGPARDAVAADRPLTGGPDRPRATSRANAADEVELDAVRSRGVSRSLGTPSAAPRAAPYAPSAPVAVPRSLGVGVGVGVAPAARTYGNQPPSGARVPGSSYAIPRDPPLHRPSPGVAPMSPTAPDAVRTLPPAGVPARQPYNSGAYGRQAPDRSAAPDRPTSPPDSVGRAVPRPGGYNAPPADARPGGDRRGPDRPAGAPAPAGRSHAGARGR